MVDKETVNNIKEMMNERSRLHEQIEKELRAAKDALADMHDMVIEHRAEIPSSIYSGWVNNYAMICIDTHSHYDRIENLKECVDLLGYFEYKFNR